MMIMIKIFVAAAKRRGAELRRERLLGAAAAQVTQARKCCDHAQLTDYWKSFHGDLQLQTVCTLFCRVRVLCNSM
jgi:hypothetical protein